MNKFSLNFFVFILHVALTCTSLHSYTQHVSHSSESLSTANLAKQDQQHQLLSRFTRHALHIRQIIQQLGSQITSNQFQVQDVSTVLHQLTRMDEQVEHLQEQIPMVISDCFITEQFKQLQEITQTLELLVKTRTLIPSTVDSTKWPHSTTKELVESILQQQIMLDTLSQEIPLLGLSPRQRVYKRTIDYLQERGFGMRTIAAGSTAALLFTIFLYSIKQEDFANITWLNNIPGLARYKQWLGEPYNDNLTAEDVIRLQQANNNGAPIRHPSLIASLHRIAEKSFGVSVIALAPILWRSSLQKWLETTAESFKNDILAQHHAMMGNTYKPTGVQRYITTGFEAVIGNEDLKKLLMTIAEYACLQEKFERRKSTPPKALLLCGKSRAGKTFIAQQFAGYINQRLAQLGKTHQIPFIELKPQDLFQARVNGGLRKYFSERIKGPAVVFIDEIHLLRLNKGGDNEMLNEFLTLMSGFESNQDRDQIILIAATNHPEDLDPALLQPGRFGKPRYIEYPGATHRKEFLLKELARVHVQLTPEYINYVVQQTDGQSFEMIRDIINLPLRESIMRNEPMTQAMIDRAIDELIFGIKKKKPTLGEVEMKLLSIGIAGRTLATILLSPTVRVVRSTIAAVGKPVKSSTQTWVDKKESSATTLGGVFVCHTKDKSEFTSSAEVRNQIKQLVAGRAAQQLILQEISNVKDDPAMITAYELSLQLVSRGLDVEKLSQKVQDELSQQAYSLLQELEQETIQLLSAHTDKIQLIAQALHKKTILHETEIRELLTQA